MGLDYYFLQQTPEITMGIAILLLVAIVGARANFVSFLYDSEINSAVKAAQAVFHAEISLRSADSEAHTQNVREIQTELGKHLAESLKNVTDRINGAQDILGHLTNKAQEAVDGLMKGLEGLWNSIKEIFGKRSLDHTFQEMQQEVVAKTVHAVMSKRFIGDLWQGIKDTFGSIINGIGSGMKAFGDWIGDLVQKGVELPSLILKTSSRWPRRL